MPSNRPFIHLRGVRQNNLKNLDLDLPLGKMIAVTGVSGSGKSSLVFETLHAEGQRRYVETFSPYTRQFLELLDRPKVDSIQNIPPSIAIEQTNTVRNSRSTIGTMTELCDFFKVWFASSAELFDPATGKKIEDDNPGTIWEKLKTTHAGENLLLTFLVTKPKGLDWSELLLNLHKQGYTRALVNGSVQRLEKLDAATLAGNTEVYVIQDRIAVRPANRNRFLEATETALHYGHGEVFAFTKEASPAGHFCQGLQSPATKQKFRAPTPALFSFNSPLGACSRCRGFGRIIEIDHQLAIPDRTVSLRDGAIKAWQGAVYGESYKDLLRFARTRKIPLDLPFNKLSPEQQELIVNGELGYGENGYEWPRAWYGIKGFFNWLETKTYKMHVRIFLAKYRTYRTCPDCGGGRLQAESLCWKWKTRTLPDLYNTPVSDLLPLLHGGHVPTGNRQVDIAFDSILSRLSYLDQVGLGYLTLDRSSRTLSGGEVERVNLTACLGTSLVDTLFVLDEPSVGLHCRDIDRLISILRRLTDQGNTVVVVEHDEAIIAAADEVLEIGPRPGREGGQLVFQGDRDALLRSNESLTGRYLSGRLTINSPPDRRPPPKPRAKSDWLRFRGAKKHNIRGIDVSIPLQRFVCLSGVSGSGKSTLLNHVVHDGLLRQRGQLADDPAEISSIEGADSIDEVVLVDQSPLSRTPRSNPALYCGAWEEIRKLFAGTEAAQGAGLTASSFSFNAGDGRCEHCRGLGYEKVEMQFLSDVFVTCPICEGRRFKPEVLAVTWKNNPISEILNMTVDDAAALFEGNPRIIPRLDALRSVGLGYLTLGQPLNTLSGGESQRLKLVRYLPQLGKGGRSAAQENPHALLLLDEPTTGLHRHDIKRLIGVLQTLVAEGHSLIVIEHQTDVIKSADWVIEMGPEAGAAGGTIVATGPPEKIARSKAPTAPFLRASLEQPVPMASSPCLLAAEDPGLYSDFKSQISDPQSTHSLVVTGAREHNLKNITLSIPHKEITVITGVSGSGKSSLAFDIIFAEGQRRFLESMSAYARQFVEQLPRPDIDRLTGIPPTVAIEQRVTTGNRKSTVATVTEVAQYLRLLYARIGVQHSPATGEAVASLSPAALSKRFDQVLAQPKVRRLPHLYLCSPLVRGRKGHHQPIATWISQHGYQKMRVDGRLIDVSRFKKLDRYREHDIEVVIADLQPTSKQFSPAEARKKLKDATALGKGSCFLLDPKGTILTWFSTTRTDPVTGEAFPELDPKHFSFNSARGWCPDCRGYGRLYPWLFDEEDEEDSSPVPAEPEFDWDEEAPICDTCSGDRLNSVSRAVKLYFTDGSTRSLPDLLRMSASDLIASLRRLRLDKRGKAIIEDILPQIEERLRFLDEVGLSYLNLDRSAQTLSGGEAQRIRLAGQLGSNLSGVLYVLDEPSIGLHARDNHRLIDALEDLRNKGNTLVIVEHDEDTMRHADRIIDLGPAAGRHGGEVLAEGTLDEISREERSLTGRYLKTGMVHPLLGSYRSLSASPGPRQRKVSDEWLVLRKPSLRNLKGDDLYLPLGRLVLICGVSGAGKSTLIRDLLLPAVEIASTNDESFLKGHAWGNNGTAPFKSLVNGHLFEKTIEVDQTPIGKTPRSTPATYLGIFDLIRKVFSELPESKMRGYMPGRFSFNTPHGRCETCQGAGRIKFEMNFLPTAYLPCEDCGGSRYGPELQEIRWKDKSIGDVLNLTFDEACEFFNFHSQLCQACQLMVDTGLGYLTLGQSSPTLSGGEAQRLKLVSEVMRGLPTYREKTRGLNPRHLFILEEPTIGLHFTDCEKLIRLVHRLVDQGHTVVVIEHNLDLIAEADYVVEIGPEGGDAGGRILYQGNVAGLKKQKNSPTAPFLTA